MDAWLKFLKQQVRSGALGLGLAIMTAVWAWISRWGLLGAILAGVIVFTCTVVLLTLWQRGGGTVRTVAAIGLALLALAVGVSVVSVLRELSLRPTEAQVAVRIADAVSEKNGTISRLQIRVDNLAAESTAFHRRFDDRARTDSMKALAKPLETDGRALKRRCFTEYPDPEVEKDASRWRARVAKFMRSHGELDFKSEGYSDQAPPPRWSYDMEQARPERLGLVWEIEYDLTALARLYSRGPS